MIDTLLYHDRFIWRNETELQRLAPDEIAEVKSLIKKVCAWSGLSKAEWKIAWESFARNSDEFHPFPDMRAQRYALLLKHNILGGAFKYADGFYFIVLSSPKTQLFSDTRCNMSSMMPIILRLHIRLQNHDVAGNASVHGSAADDKR